MGEWRTAELERKGGSRTEEGGQKGGGVLGGGKGGENQNYQKRGSGGGQGGRAGGVKARGGAGEEGTFFPSFFPKRRPFARVDLTAR